MALHGADDFSKDVADVHKRAKEQELEDLFQGQKGAQVGGRRRGAAAATRENMELYLRTAAANGMAALNSAFQAQLDDINGRINLYEGQIQATDQLIDFMKQGGKLDPNNPEHQKMLKAAGIPEDQWHNITLQDLQDHKQGLQTKLADANAEKVALKEANDKVDENIKSKNNINLGIDNNTAKTELVDLVSTTELKKLDSETQKIKTQTNEIQALETKLVASTFLEINNLKGTPAYTAKLEQLIDTLDPDTKQKMKDSDDTPPELKALLEVDNLVTKAGKLEKYVGTEKYEAYAAKLLGNIDENTLYLASQNNKMPNDFKIKINDLLEQKQLADNYKPFADTLDKKPSPKPEPANLKAAFNATSPVTQQPQEKDNSIENQLDKAQPNQLGASVG